MTDLSHLDEYASIRMVDVGEKPVTSRLAIAKGEVHLLPETVSLIRKGLLKKGDVLSVARVAGILAAKRTAELIPLCHPLLIDHADVQIEMDDTIPGIQITATVRTNGKTGVEMEALTSVAVAALTVYDMVKAVERNARIQNIRLVEKHGGKSGDLVNE